MAETDPELLQFYREYAEQVPAMIARIEALWSAARSSADAASVKALHAALHALAGSAGTFGLKPLGSHAKDFELALEPYLDATPTPAAGLDALAPLLESLRSVAATPGNV